MVEERKEKNRTCLITFLLPSQKNACSKRTIYQPCVKFVQHNNKASALCLKLWTDITPSNVSFDNFEQSIGQKLTRIYGA